MVLGISRIGNPRPNTMVSSQGSSYIITLNILGMGYLKDSILLCLDLLSSRHQLLLLLCCNLNY